MCVCVFSLSYTLPPGRWPGLGEYPVAGAAHACQTPTGVPEATGLNSYGHQGEGLWGDTDPPRRPFVCVCSFPFSKTQSQRVKRSCSQPNRRPGGCVLYHSRKGGSKGWEGGRARGKCHVLGCWGVRSL